MPPTFPVFAGALALAALCPVVALGALIALLMPRSRSNAARVLAAGCVASIVAAGLWCAVVVPGARSGPVPWDAAAIYVGAAFTLGAIAMAVFAGASSRGRRVSAR